MTTEKGCRKDKNQNIQVFVRLRPLNQRERDIKSLGVVEVVNGREVVVRQSQQTAHTKRFTFDRAFPPNAKQFEVYQEVVSPLIEEVLSGYNCTVFAYGQTGTGKTHTMVGESTANETSWQNDPMAGIIPRALSQLFDELRISNTEYTVRVSYLELYNEELFDLLSSSEDNSKLRIYEDVTRKGSNIVNGLEEITVYNKTEVYKIMAQGQERKRVASTLMNAQSSRSHTVFTIVVHMKENSAEGEELVKIGKLNLVDLAGSENISKAGSDNPAKRERARECVNINQSLLTLGRVITALVERHPHIPYRESKLTRILQESLGGRTKTSIIATVSPGHRDLEETMSTLEYANRAKNIQNKPEVNQKMTKKAILKEYAEEIDRLKRDLQAARDKNGVYLANETFAEMTLKQEEQKKEIQELLLKKRAMEEERERMEAIFAELSHKLEQKETQLSATVNQLSSTRDKLATTSKMLQTTKLHFEESRYLVAKQQETEAALAAQARQILAAADAAAAAAGKLHDNVDKRRNIESANLEITRTYRDISAQHRGNIAGGLHGGVRALGDAVRRMQAALDSFSAESGESCAASKLKLEQLVRAAADMANGIESLKASAVSQLSSVAGQHCSGTTAALRQHSGGVERALTSLVQSVLACCQRCERCDVGSHLQPFLQHWRTTISSNLSALRASHAAFKQDVERGIGRRALTARRQTGARHEQCEAHAQDISQRILTIQAYKEDTDKRLAQKLQEIETERTETERRLETWIAQEKKHLEERLQRRIDDIAAERAAFETRVKDELGMMHSLLEQSRRSGRAAGEDMRLNVAEAEDDLHSVQQLAEDCERECDTLAVDVETLLDNALGVVEEVKAHLVRELHATKDEVQEESKKHIESNTESTQQIADSTEQVIADLLQHCRATLDTVVNQVNENNASTVQHLSSLSSAAAGLGDSVTSHRGLQSEALAGLQRDLEQLYRGVRREVDSLAELEARCLNQEYAVYTPTGGTPARTEYRWPRALAATSPHERILARFRAMRSNANDDECVVVESENESRSSDTESSEASEDSALASACPSPPAGAPPINKCSSETDIYASHRQHENGKENASRSMCFKKPSKLPALSAKKPLASRNDNSQ